MKTIILATVMFMFGNCGEAEPEWVAIDRADSGNACVSGEADAAGEVIVNAEVCLSSSCSRAATGSCSATVDGSTITVTSTFSWEEATGDIACTDDCGSLSATCATDALPAGEYTLVHGDQSETITIPNEDPCESGW